MIATLRVAALTALIGVPPIFLANCAHAGILDEIARCESGGRQFDARGHVLMGGAGHRYMGLYQFGPAHIPLARRMGWDLRTVAGQQGYARELYREVGLTPWAASRACWGRAASIARAAAEMPAARYPVLP